MRAGTYLRPESEITLLDIDPGQPCNRSGRPNVRESIRCPVKTTVPDGNGVDLANETVVGELLCAAPVNEHDQSTERETQKEGTVLTLGAKDLDRTNRSPQDGSSEEGVGSRAGHSHGSSAGANTFDVDLILHHGGGNKGADECADHLGGKGVPWRNLEVVSHLQVIGKADSMCTSDITK